jgi:signal transduction histidine kinase
VRWRIRYQLLLPLFLLLLGVVGLSVWMAVAAAGRAWNQIEDRVRTVAEHFGEHGTYPLNATVLSWIKDLSGADYLVLRPEGDRLTTLSGSPAPPRTAVYDDWQSLRLGPPVQVGDRTYLCSAIHLRRDPNAGDTLYILYPESLWRDARWQAVWPFLVLGGSVGLASVVLAAGLGQHLGGRIQELERRTRRIAAGDFSPMPLPRSNDEIRDLARSVNEMADRLAKFQEAVQRTERLRLLGQVSGGLAHQLRNGLTGARLAVQLYTREAAGRIDTAALEVALRQLTLLETYLKRFLDLGREDSRRREPCALAALVGEAADLLRPQCRHAGIDLRWQAPAEEAVVLGDPGQLGQLVQNVLGNAVEAAGPGGEVEVRLHGERGASAPCLGERGASAPCLGERGASAPCLGERGASAPCLGERGASAPCCFVLEVRDSGPGPAPEVAGRLFEPFVTGKPEGVGLGLAVARQVAEAHGGRIAWERADGRTVFRIELPAALRSAEDGDTIKGGLHPGGP